MQENPSLSRRRFIINSTATGLAGGVMLSATKALAQDTAIVEIEHGKLRGTRGNSAVSFRGIPYAADTGGKNRFMAPQPVQPWNGVRDAFVVGDRCPQETETMSANPVFAWYRQPGDFSENCCVLNVFTPDLDRQAKRPVMIYLHGGGFQGGSGGGPLLDGTNLARQGDVVVVAINHRINTFGFAHLGFLDQRFADATNAGMLDIVAALKWIRSNIHAFGGDPGNVTIFGESGGGSKVMLLLAMPSAKGLFHRAINQSGVSGLRLQDASSAEPYVLELLKTLDIDRSNVARLQDVPAQVLLKAWGTASRAAGQTGAGPLREPGALPFHPSSDEGLALNANIPLMMGNCDTEITLFLRRDMRNFNITADQLRERLKATFKLDDTKALAVIDAYAKAVPGRTPTDILIAVGTDALFRAQMIRGAEARSAKGKAPVYLYNFTFKAPAEGGIWRTPHAMDIPFVFGNTHQTTILTGTGPEPAMVSKKMLDTWVAFARSGNPNNAGIPAWPQYDAHNRATMTFNTDCKVVNDYHGGDRLANQGLSTTSNSGALYEYKA